MDITQTYPGCTRMSNTPFELKEGPMCKGQLSKYIYCRALYRLFGSLWLMAGAACSQTSGQAGKPVLYYIPHTHWEGAVFKTREEYLELGLPNILKALALLKAYPEFKFTLDQAAYVKPFLERYPEEAAAFRKFVADGRLQMVGGMDVMPDVVKPGGELFVRQMQYGKRYFRENLGVDVKIAWLVDTFGHHPQMPQLLKQAGFTSFWFCRGVPSNKMPSEFLWRGIDGTDISAIWLPGFYGLFYGPPNKPNEFANFFKSRFDTLNPNAERVGLAGVDVSEPEAYVPPMVAEFNRNPDRPFTILYSVPTEFADVVARRTDRPVITGDFNPIFQGTYSSRIELKQRTREIERKLLTAEKLSALSAWLGAPAQDEMLWRAWEPMLFNQTHDLASGVMTDHVYEDVQRGYDLSSRLADEIISDGWERLSSRIDTRGEGIPVIVFNTLAWPRTEPAEVEVGFAGRGISGVEVIDATGHATPAQIVRADRYEDGGIKRATVAFTARDLPSMGYAVYRIQPRNDKSSAQVTANERAGTDSIENEFYRVTFELKSGAITSLFDKTLKWEALSGPANVVSCQEDKGDLWELYHGLDGGSYIAMTNKQPVPTTANSKLSSGYSAQPGTIRHGSVFSEFTVTHPLDSGTFATRVRVYSGSRRVDIETQLLNKEKFVRYQALFPTSVSKGQNVQEIPFGAVERPAGIEYPAQQWADYSGSNRGVALINAGMPGNLVTDGTLMLSLMRSHTIGGYGFGGGYEPGMSSDTGLELGVPRSFHYAVVPHAGDWAQAGVYRDGWEFNHPLIVRKAAHHAGTLPNRWGLVDVSHPNVVFTALKPGPEGTTVVRVYEASGKASTDVTLNLRIKVAAAWESDLLEKPGRKLKVEKDAVRFDLHPFEIKTILLKLSRPKGL